jgi:hypothetical protein
MAAVASGGAMALDTAEEAADNLGAAEGPAVESLALAGEMAYPPPPGLDEELWCPPLLWWGACRGARAGRVG